MRVALVHYWLVGMAGGVLYADQSMDLTQDVLAEVNKLYKAGGPKKDDKK